MKVAQCRFVNKFNPPHSKYSEVHVVEVAPHRRTVPFSNGGGYEYFRIQFPYLIFVGLPRVCDGRIYDPLVFFRMEPMRKKDEPLGDLYFPNVRDNHSICVHEFMFEPLDMVDAFFSSPFGYMLRNRRVSLADKRTRAHQLLRNLHNGDMSYWEKEYKNAKGTTIQEQLDESIWRSPLI